MPSYSQTFGPEVVDLAASVDLYLDADQAALMDDWFAVQPSGRWVTTENGVKCQRQNLKTISFEAAALGCMFLFDDELCVWTAHEFPTTQEAFRDLHGYVENYDHLRRRVKTVHTANGSEGIELTNGHRLNFRARTKRSGRGLTGKKMFLDEAQELEPAHMGSLVPTLSAVYNAQIFYGGTACKLTSEVWRTIRDRGRRGGEARLAYREWRARHKDCKTADCSHVVGSDGCALDDERLLEEANPALDRRITREFIRLTERGSMPPAEYARERFGWDEDPLPGGGALDVELWLTLAAQPPDLNAPSFGADLDEAGVGYFAVAWRRPDGLVHVQLAGRSTASKLAERASELTGKHGGRCFAGGPAVKLLDDCEAVSMEEFAAACRRFADMLAASELRHSDEQELNDAVRVARWRSVSSQGGQAWQLKDAAGIGPLAAVTRALHGLTDESPPSIW